MTLVSFKRPSLRTWLLRAAVAGLVIGAAAYLIGRVLSARHGDGEPLEGVALTLVGVTLPWSLLSVWLGDRHVPLAFVALFAVAPVLQCMSIAALLWLLDAAMRRLKHTSPAA